MSVTSNLPLVTSTNWYQWEQLALNSISVYGQNAAGRAIQTNDYPLKAIRDDFPMDVAPYPDQYKTHPTDHLPV